MSSSEHPKIKKIHASCVSVFGKGVLIQGESAIGKTECALGLTARGHRFVGDDVIVLNRVGESVIAKADAKLGTRAHLRDIGIRDVANIFGAASVVDSVAIDVVVTLTHEASSEVTTGLENHTVNILDVALPYYKIGGLLGRDVPLLIEIAVRSQN